MSAIWQTLAFTVILAFVSVFLGGSCNPTSWRADIAIPFLKENGITFYNPVSVNLKFYCVFVQLHLYKYGLCQYNIRKEEWPYSYNV